jgi:hypothetical protein
LWRVWRSDAAYDDADDAGSPNPRQRLNYLTIAPEFETVRSEISGILSERVSRFQRESQIGVEPDGKPDARRSIQAKFDVLLLNRGCLHHWLGSHSGSAAGKYAERERQVSRGIHERIIAEGKSHKADLHQTQVSKN